MIESVLRVRMASHDAHYSGNLVDGARILSLFGDLATEMLIRKDGDEGLLAKYTDVEFSVPVYGGDFIEVRGRIVSSGNRSRKMEFEAYKIISSTRHCKSPSAAKVLDQPLMVARAKGVCVVPVKHLQYPENEHVHNSLEE